MSTTIENQVVSMEFDNKHFESNVRTSLSTLEKLKQSLKLHDAAKGFENISSAAGKVNLSPLSGAVDKVGLKFSALYTIADQTLRNIVNSAERAAKNIVSSFTIDPVKTGFQEYETQLNSVQTILANTRSKGATLADVNAALDELNVYADKTIYNFTEMTRNIGTFTAAGVGLNESVSAIKGIANLAAISGSTSQQASTAMYQLSQALATGTVRLQDWNSVVNAGMGGEVFQTALKRTAEHMGTNVDALIEKYGSFRDSLTQGEWLTTEVLTETLAQLSGAYTEADLIAQGYTEKQAKEIRELADTAVSAAQDVKTFTQLMSTLKESAQSGWAQSWRLIIGDFEQSKTLWTSVSEVLGDIINKSSENRNKVLSGALDNSGWDELITVVKDAKIEVTDFEEEVKKLAKEQNIDIDSLVKKYGSLEGAVQACKLPVDLLQKAFNNLFGKKSGKFEEYTVKAGDTLSELAEKWNTSVEEIMFLNDFIKDPDEIITGWKIKIPKAIEETGKAAKDAGKHAESFAEALKNVGEKGGRELLLESFSNIWGGIRKIFAGDDEKGFDGIADVWNDLFSISSDQLMGLIEGFNKLSIALVPTDETAQKITRTFRGLFSVLDILGYVLGGGVKIGFKILTKILDSFDLNILDVLAGAGDAIYNFSQNIEKGIGSVIEFFTKLYMLPEVQAVIKSFKDEYNKLKEALVGRWNKGVDAFWKWIESIKELDGLSLENIGKALSDFRDNVLGAFFGTKDGGTIFDGLIGSIQKFLNVLKTKSSEVWTNLTAWFDRIKQLDGLSLDNVKAALVDFYKNVIKPIFVKEDGTTIFDSLGESITKFWNSVKEWFGKLGVDLDGLADKVVNFFKLDGLSIGETWTTAIETFGKIKDGIVGFVTGIVKFLDKHKGTIFVVGTFISMMLLIKKALDVAGTIADAIGFLSDVGEGFKDFTKGLGKSLKWTGFKSFAEGIAILVGAVGLLWILGKDQGRLWSAIGAIAAISAISVGLFALASFISNKMGTADLTKFAVSILAISGSLLVFAIAAKKLGEVGWESLGKAGAVLGGLMLFMLILSKLSETSTGLGSSMNGFGKMLLGIGGFLLMVAGAVAIFGHMDDGTLKKGIIAVSVMLGELIIVMAATNLLAKVGKKSSIVKMGSIAMALGTALLLMAGAVAIFGNMDRDTLVQGAIAVGACIMALVGVMGATKLLARTSDKGSIVNVGGLFASLGGALLMMAASVAIFGNMDTKTLIKGGAAVAVFLGMMVGVMAATKLLATTSGTNQFAKVGGMMLAFASALILISAAVAILSTMDYKDLVRSTIIIGGIGIMMMGLMVACRGISPKTTGTIVALAGTLLILVGSIILLTYVDTDKLKVAALAIGGVIGVVALLAAALKGPAISPKNILGIAGAVAAILAIVSIFAAIGIASLPVIGKKMSEFMGELTKEGGFIEGVERLAGITKVNPGVLKDIAALMSAMGELATGALKVAIIDILPFVDSAAVFETLADWIDEVVDIIVDLGPKLNGVSINHANLKAVIGAVKTLTECASLVPSATAAGGGFTSKWVKGGAGVISIPMLTAAKDWIADVVPVVKSTALDVSKDGITVNKTSLEAVCTAATSLAEAAALAPSVTVAGGGFTSKWVTGGGGVIDWPLLTQAKDWIVGVEPAIRKLATSVTSGDAKGLDGAALTAVCEGAKTLAEAAASAPSVDVVLGLAGGPWGFGFGTIVTVPLIDSVANWIIKVKDPITRLASSVKSIGFTKLDGENFTTITTAVKTLCEAAESGPDISFAGMLSIGGFSWVTIGGAISIPIIDGLATFITNVKDPIIALAKATSSGTDGIKNFNKDNFNAIIGGVNTLSEAAKNSPSIDGGLLLNVGKFSGVTLAGGITWPLIDGLSNFITNVKQPIIDLAKATSSGADGIKNFNKENFETILEGIVKIAAIEFPSITIGGGLAEFHGLLAAGGFMDIPMVNSVANLISSTTTPIINLANAVSGVGDKDTAALKDFNADNFKTIVQAIVDIASVEFPTYTEGGLLGGGGTAGVLAVAAGYARDFADMTGTVKFIASVTNPIIELANAISGVGAADVTKLSNFNADNFKTIVQAIVDIGSIKFNEVDGWGGGGIFGSAAFVGIGGAGGSKFADFTGTVKFINDVRDPIITLAKEVSKQTEGAPEITDTGKANLESVVKAIVALSEVNVPEKVDVSGGAFTLIGAGKFSTEVSTQFTEFANFVSAVTDPIITLCNAVSDKDFTVNKTNIDNVISAITALAGADIPDKTTISFGGLNYENVTDFTGFVDFIAGDGTNPGVGDALSRLNDAVKDLSLGDGSKVAQAANLVSGLATAAKSIPKKVTWPVFGDVEKADFQGFVSFIGDSGEHIATMTSKLTTVDAGQLDKALTAAEAIRKLAEAAEVIPKGNWTAGTNWEAFKQSIPDFATGISTFVTNLKDVNMETALEGAKIVYEMAVAVASIANLTHGNTIDLNPILDTFDDLATYFPDSIKTFVTELEGVEMASIPTALSYISTITEAITTASTCEDVSLADFKTNAKSLAEGVVDFATTAEGSDPSTALDNLGRLVAALSAMTGVNFSGATSFNTALTEIAKTSIDNFINAFSSDTTVADVTAAGAKLPGYVIDGIDSKTEDATTAGTSIATAAKDGMGAKEVTSGFTTAGENAGAGFVSGVSSKVKDATDAGTALGKAALAAAMAALDENSPSKEFYKVGAFAGIGLVNALNDYSDKTYNAGYDMAESARSGLGKAISKVRNLIENGVDAQPTIRPVLDLSDVSAGATRINRMFGTPSVGLLSRVNTVNAMMNGIQNGGNDDVISAINDLGKRLGNVSGNTYNINGVTYDDGSNITKAVETLVKAAIRERRV